MSEYPNVEQVEAFDGYRFEPALIGACDLCGYREVESLEDFNPYQIQDMIDRHVKEEHPDAE